MYKELYKQSLSTVELQNARRRTLLEKQKTQRAAALDESRHDLESIVEQAHINSNFNTKSNKKHNKWKSQHYFREFYGSAHSLQHSEWMRERPEQLSDWLLVACPKGQRCMVVACNGRTEMFTKAGRLQWSFRSALPGDGCRNGNERNAITMLDCVYVREQRTFYVLDALAFGTQDLLQCEAQFRFFWLRSKFAELEDETESNVKTMPRFVCLEQHDFEDATNVSVALQRFPYWPENAPELDGFLFYHKEADYTCGTTPLVGWLLPFMLPELLGYAVSEEYVTPANYVDALQFMREFDALLMQKQAKKKLQQRQSMDVEDEQQQVERMESEILEKQRELGQEQLDEADDKHLKSLLAAEMQLELEDVEFVH